MRIVESKVGGPGIQWHGKRNIYWITLDVHPNGGVIAQAAPVTPEGWTGPAFRTVGDTADEAEKLLMEKLQKAGA